jgi:hypothetical protein
MPATPSPQQTPSVGQAKHSLSAMTTYELRDYRRQLESAIAFFGKQSPVPPARNQLQATLEAVITEQAERSRIAAHG